MSGVEFAGLAIGIVSLYNACIQIGSQFKAYSRYGIESQATFAQIEAYRIRLQDWADSVGIKDDSLVDPHDPRLDDPRRAPIIKFILASVKKTFHNIEGTLSSITLSTRQQAPQQVIWGPKSSVFKSEPEPRESPSTRSRILWSLRKREKLKKDIGVLEDLVNALYHVASPVSYQISSLATTFLPNDNEDSSTEVDCALQEIRENLLEIDKIDVLEWLDASKYDDEFEKHISLHLDGTCEWILSHPAYLEWQSASTIDTGAKFLWVHGSAGVGKTVLSAWLIRHVRQNLKLPIAYAFISGHASKTDTLDGIVRTWITHIAQQGSGILDLCRATRRQHNTRRASGSMIWQLLRKVLVRCPSCVFALDGLDEYPTLDDTRSNFLKQVKKAFASTRAKFLITSRNETDIESEINTFATQRQEYLILECKISRQDVKSDIDLYSQFVVAKKFPKYNDSSRRELSAQMAEKASGMFLWIKLQQYDLRSTQNTKTIQQIIRGMPRGLDQTYRRNLDSILSAAEPDRNRAVDILRWLTFGYQAFTVQEMTEALSIELDETKEAFQTDNIPAQIDNEYNNIEIRGLCHSLVEIRDEVEVLNPSMSTIHLVHASVKQYLTIALPAPALANVSPDHHSQFAMHHALLAAFCLRFLNDSQAWYGSNSGGPRSFTAYAVHSWFHHLRESGEFYGKVSSFVNDFLKLDNINFRNWRVRYEKEPHFPWIRHQGDTAIPYYDTSLGLLPHQENAIPIYYACLFGLLPTMDHLYGKGDQDIDSVGGVCGTPLQAACSIGSEVIFDRLMSWGADVTVQGGWRHHALNAAAYHGRNRMVKILLECETITGLSRFQTWEATTTAAAQGHLEVVRLLLDHSTATAPKGLFIPEKSAHLSMPLLAAAGNGHPAIVKLLLDHGAGILDNESNDDTPLHLAAQNNHIEVVEILLQPKMSSMSEHSHTESGETHGYLPMTTQWLNKKGKDNATPLHHAARLGYVDIVATLLANGADISAQTESGCTPLYLALERHSMNTARLLLNYNEDVSNQTAESIKSINSSTATPILDYEATYSPGIYGRQQIDPETQYECNWTVNLLLDRDILLNRGGSPDVRARYGAMALSLALCTNNAINVETLLRRGADPTIPDENGVTPLFCAAGNGSLRLVRSLIAKGCDINAATKFGDTPLREAITRATSDELVLELIHQGADLSKTDLFGMTCYDWLRLLRPHLSQASQHSPELSIEASVPDTVLLRRKTSELAAAIRKELARQKWGSLRLLARYLLMLGSEDDARQALQTRMPLAGLGVLCDVCQEDHNGVDPFYNCKTCPDTDLCQSCMIEHQEAPLLVLCRDHKFLRFATSEAKIRPDQTEAFDGWLRGIEERYRSVENTEVA